MNFRASGILLHITSLPSEYGIGDIGPAAYRFADWLSRTRQRYWQILPLNPTAPEHDHSPYHSNSLFAANPLLISPELLARQGLIEESDLQPVSGPDASKADLDEAVAYKKRIFHKAVESFLKKSPLRAYIDFCREERHWLDDFALFRALQEKHEKLPWNRWPVPVMNRESDAITEMRAELEKEIESEKILQFLFALQWQHLRDYCSSRNVVMVGDLPIYAQHDSADVWSHPEYFKLDERGNPSSVSGVPPDYFSETGQLWGHPIYKWDKLKETRFNWWIARMARNLQLYDIVRIDHFRGLVGYWEVPACETTAMNGEWRDAPAWELLNALQRRYPFMPFIAEDLGTITADVREVIANFRLPGMRVLQFGMDESVPGNPHAPHNYPRHCIAYPGTHDNNTARGWFEEEAGAATRNRIMHYAGIRFSPETAADVMIRMVMASVADTAIFPMQDVLGLGEDARMNRPGTASGNWRWRLPDLERLDPTMEKLRAWTWLYGRS